MTDSMTALIMKIVEDLPECLHTFLQKQFTEKKDNQTVSVRLPVRVTLPRQPGHKYPISAERILPLDLSPQEIQLIETYAAPKHLSQKDALLELLKLSLHDYEPVQEAIRQARGKLKSSQGEIEVELWRNEKRTDNHAA